MLERIELQFDTLHCLHNVSLTALHRSPFSYSHLKVVMRNSSKLTGDNPQVHNKTASLKDSCDSKHSDEEYVNEVSKTNYSVINMNPPTQRQQGVKNQGIFY